MRDCVSPSEIRKLRKLVRPNFCSLEKGEISQFNNFFNVLLRKSILENLLLINILISREKSISYASYHKSQVAQLFLRANIFSRCLCTSSFPFTNSMQGLALFLLLCIAQVVLSVSPPQIPSSFNSVVRVVVSDSAGDHIGVGM